MWIRNTQITESFKLQTTDLPGSPLLDKSLDPYLTSRVGPVPGVGQQQKLTHRQIHTDNYISFWNRLNQAIIRDHSLMTSRK